MRKSTSLEKKTELKKFPNLFVVGDGYNFSIQSQAMCMYISLYFYADVCVCVCVLNFSSLGKWVLVKRTFKKLDWVLGMWSLWSSLLSDNKPTCGWVVRVWVVVCIWRHCKVANSRQKWEALCLESREAPTAREPGAGSTECPQGCCVPLEHSVCAAQELSLRKKVAVSVAWGVWAMGFGLPERWGSNVCCKCAHFTLRKFYPNPKKTIKIETWICLILNDVHEFMKLLWALVSSCEDIMGTTYWKPASRKALS